MSGGCAVGRVLAAVQKRRRQRRCYRWSRCCCRRVRSEGSVRRQRLIWRVVSKLVRLMVMVVMSMQSLSRRMMTQVVLLLLVRMHVVREGLDPEVAPASGDCGGSAEAGGVRQTGAEHVHVWLSARARQSTRSGSSLSKYWWLFSRGCNLREPDLF